MAVFVKFMYALTCVACLGAVTHARDVASSDSHPIEKVIDLLKGLKADAFAEGQSEAVLYQKFALWCSQSLSSLGDATVDEKDHIAELSDLLAGKTTANESLTTELAELDEQLGKLYTSAEHTESLRLNGAQAYGKTMKNAKETIAAVDAALASMVTAEDNTEFVQKHARKIISLISFGSSETVTGPQMSMLQALADPVRAEARAKKEAARPDQLAKADKSAHVDKYDFKSENVVELLKELKSKFSATQLTATQEETNAIHEFELAELARDNEIKAVKRSSQKKTDLRANVEDTIAEATHSLDNEKDDFRVDSKTLEDTKQQCATKKRQWEDRSDTRKNEISSMDAAIEILAEVSGVRTKPPGNPIPPVSPASLIQIDQFVSEDDAGSGSNKMLAVTLLLSAAQRTHSKALERLAVEMKAHLSGPFDQLNNMVEKMIFHLQDEQRQENEHKQWCDHELENSDAMYDNQNQKHDDLSASHRKEQASVGLLTADIADTNQMIHTIVAFTEEATEIRTAGKRENTLAIKDAEHAQKALGNAIAVLTSFYKESGHISKEPWEFIQRPATAGLSEKPETWARSYTGLSNPTDPKAGIISILEGVMARFAQMVADTNAQEAVDQGRYEEAMSDSNVEKARRTTELNMKSSEKSRKSAKMDSLMSDLKRTDAELETSVDYLKKLQQACVEGDSSYDARKDARTEEVDALKRAQGILHDAFEEPKKAPKKASSFLEIQRHADW